MSNVTETSNGKCRLLDFFIAVETVGYFFQSQKFKRATTESAKNVKVTNVNLACEQKMCLRNIVTAVCIVGCIF
jgi:hypothetical protein